MNDTKFIRSWSNYRKRGIVLYILELAILIPVASYVGKTIGELIGKLLGGKATLVPIFPIDYILLGLLFVLGALIGVYLWKHNEKRYEKLEKGFIKRISRVNIYASTGIEAIVCLENHALCIVRFAFGKTIFRMIQSFTEYFSKIDRRRQG